MNRPYDKKGFMLIGVMGAVTIVSILAFTLYVTMTNTYSLAKKNRGLQDAYYVARSGIEYTLHIIEDPALNPLDSSTWPNGNSFNGFGGQLDVAIADDGSSGYDITSTATASGKTKTITANSSQLGEILEWK